MIKLVDLVVKVRAVSMHSFLTWMRCFKYGRLRASKHPVRTSRSSLNVLKAPEPFNLKPLGGEAIVVLFAAVPVWPQHFPFDITVDASPR